MFWVRSDLDSGKNFISGGRGALGKGGLGLREESHFQGVLWVWSDLDSGKNFISGGGGVLWVRSDLDSGKNFISWRGVFWKEIPEQGCSGEFGQKFLEN